MDDARFLDLLDHLCRRPAMFTGERTVASVATFLTGYCIGVSHSEPGPGLLGRSSHEHWGRWVEMRYDVFDPAWSWSRILLHHHGDDQRVFEVLPSLFREFLADRDAHGAEGLAARHHARFSGRCPAPEHTHTATPC
ncbi:hypothetical protein ACF07T_31585 [Streptomyces sp. NPDC015184]|uniref:hypothetical protein n=1 Tax=Streptomyces sp. NPDC015184 TaxID=3364946 RepID=UPI00370279FF